MMSASEKTCPTVVAIGNFDGVHKGHQALLQQAKSIADAESLPLTVLTFHPHPREILFPDKPHKNLMTLDEKKAALKTHGADDVFIQPFNQTFAQTTPAHFIQNLLIETLNAKHIVIGQNFRFGHKAAGDISTLKAQKKFTTHVLPLHLDTSGEPFSSSRLRQNAL